MIVENAVYPKAEQFQALIGHNDGKPIVMLNLLKFKEKAAYADGRKTDLTGRQAYMLYGQEMSPFVESNGGKFIWMGKVEALAIGLVGDNKGDIWDVAALMQYPSAEAFMKIATHPKVQEIGVHREAGLAGQLLILCKDGGPGR
jgi:uncharacterized protein (DUF1330 family)